MKTQIIIPSDLRKEIDKARHATGETLAEYLRRAAQDRLVREKKNRVDLEALARKIRTVQKSGWEGVDVIKWQREIREDRAI